MKSEHKPNESSGLIDNLEKSVVDAWKGPAGERVRELVLPTERRKGKPTMTGGKDSGGSMELPSSEPTFVNPAVSYPLLTTYAINLTERAKLNQLDPVIGRQDEIRRMIQVLGMRRKNNPVLVGAPGTGKTSIVEGVARQIVERKVPESLLDNYMFALDLGAIVAGTCYRGDFEKRLKGLIDETINSRGKVILFIDEIHTIVGAGNTEGAMDVANLLKPALAKGSLKCIGATTTNEYRYIERDPALERRFQPVNVAEPSQDEALEVLKGLRSSYESHHKVQIETTALQAAVSLSVEYMKSRFLPDKAIDLIDEACSAKKLDIVEGRQRRGSPVTGEDIYNLLTSRTKK